MNGIYMIQNIKSGKIYIGQSSNVTYRIRRHKAMLRHSHHFNEDLQNDWNKFGESMFTFSVIESDGEFSANDRIQREEYWIKHYKDETECKVYNLKYSGHHMSEKGRLSISEKNKKMSGENHPMWGKEGYWKGRKRPEEFKKKVSETLTGHSVSDESRKKMSESHMGKVPKSKFLTTDEVIKDIKGGISYKDFMKKYRVSDDVIIRVKRELREAGII